MSKLKKLKQIANKFEDEQTEPLQKEKVLNAFSGVIGKFGKKEVIIDPELRSFIPPLSEEERQLLEDSIREEGLREDLILWKDERGHVLVDGHNRYNIIQKIQAEGKEIDYGVTILDEEKYPDFESVKDWMIINQLGRRNLTDAQRSYLRGLRYEREKGKHGGNRKSSSKIWDLTENDQSKKEKTHEKLAKEYSVSKNTILSDADFAKGLEKVGRVNPSLKREILAGAAKVNKSALQKVGKYEGKAPLKIEKTEDIKIFLNKVEPRKARQTSVSSKNEILFQKQKEKATNILKTMKITDTKSIKDLQKVIDELKKIVGKE
ncbi:ParB/Srx family N-terminal domain-containing protein [Flexithrix dorotheae]|uniref:ParB/Srx family N-terminal domain-containing protein n=1 Tax=Flexithrix dorotheae TaxID=70993 RepID=UPI00036B3E67|nr:ParB/Srx family N-terminal domain-containing protein [Flexithrix dorotheae]